MKKFWIFCALVFAGFSGYGQNTNVGDLVFVSFKRDRGTGWEAFFTILARNPIQAGTEIVLSNNYYSLVSGNQTFSQNITIGSKTITSPGEITITLNEPLSLGQTFQVTFNDAGSFSSSVGTVSQTGNLDFTSSNEASVVWLYEKYTSGIVNYSKAISGIMWNDAIGSYDYHDLHGCPPGIVWNDLPNHTATAYNSWQGIGATALNLNISGSSNKCGGWNPYTTSSGPTYKAGVSFSDNLENTFYDKTEWIFGTSNSYNTCSLSEVNSKLCSGFLSKYITYGKYLYTGAGVWKEFDGTNKWPVMSSAPDWAATSMTKEIIIHKSLDLGSPNSPFGNVTFECAKLTIEDTSGNDGVSLIIHPGNALKIHNTLNFSDIGGTKPSIWLKSAHAAGQTYYATLDPTSATLDDPDGEFIYDLHVQYPGWHHFQSPISTTFANVSATAISPATSTFTFTDGAVGTGNTFSWNPTTSQWAQISTADNFSSTPYTVLFQTTEVPCVLTVRGTLASPDQDAVANLTANYHNPTSNGNVPGWTSDGDDGWNFYGNPYISALSTEDLLGIYSSNGNGQSNKMYGLDNKVYVWQPNSTVTNQTSDYRTKTYLNTSGTFAHGGDATAQYLPPFQAFFMRRGSGNANTSGFTKSKKYRKTTSLTSSNSIVNKTSGMTSQYELRLKNLGTNIVSTLYTVPFGKNRFVDLSGDVLAFNNTTTFGMAYDSMLFAIKFWPISQEDTSSIDVLVSHPVQGESFVLSSPNSDAYILDKATGTLHSFQQGDYSFSHDSAYNASARFQWIFAPNATVGIEETLLPPVPLKVKVDAFQVEFEYPEDVAIHILDLQGREVMKGAITNGSFIWETSHQAPGAYIITSELFSEKFILP